MYTNVLRSIENIETWPVISFVIFFVFFLCLLWWAFTADKNFIAHMSNMPISDDGQSNQLSDNKIQKI